MKRHEPRNLIAEGAYLMKCTIGSWLRTSIALLGLVALISLSLPEHTSCQAPEADPHPIYATAPESNGTITRIPLVRVTDRQGRDNLLILQEFLQVQGAVAAQAELTVLPGQTLSCQFLPPLPAELAQTLPEPQGASDRPETRGAVFRRAQDQPRGDFFVIIPPGRAKKYAQQAAAAANQAVTAALDAESAAIHSKASADKAEAAADRAEAAAAKAEACYMHHH
jgi:hypothetical protein